VSLLYWEAWQSPGELTLRDALADVFTTWSGGVPIDEFIKISLRCFLLRLLL
jgi:hypothetical protein